MQQGRPDESFGDPTGSIDVYRALCAAGTAMSTYPRDPLPAAALGIIGAVFDAYPPLDDWVASYSIVCNFLKFALPLSRRLHFRPSTN